MNCPNCNSMNEYGSQFCISCGHRLAGHIPTLASAADPIAQSSRDALWLDTARLLITLFFVWILREVLASASFTEGLTLVLQSGGGVSAAQIIQAVADLLIVGLLFKYANSLRSLWPQAFPRWSWLTSLLVSIVIVLVLSAVYRAVAPFLQVLTDASAIRVLRFALLAVAAVIVVSAGLSAYRLLPTWIRQQRLKLAFDPINQIACPDCGKLNSSDTAYCGYCGQRLGNEEVHG